MAILAGVECWVMPDNAPEPEKAPEAEKAHDPPKRPRPQPPKTWTADAIVSWLALWGLFLGAMFMQFVYPFFFK